MIVKLLSRDVFIQWHREISISKLLNQREMPNFTSITNTDSSINEEINAKAKWNAVSNLLTAIFLSLLVLYATVTLFRNFFASPYQDSCLIALAFYQFRAFYWINVDLEKKGRRLGVGFHLLQLKICNPNPRRQPFLEHFYGMFLEHF